MDRPMMGRNDKKHGTSGYVRELRRGWEGGREGRTHRRCREFYSPHRIPLVGIISYRLRIVIGVYVS